MTVKRQQTPIRFEQHALDRMRERLPGTKQSQIRGRLRSRINTALRVGAPVYWGAIRVQVDELIWCVCAPDWFGWTVVTIVDRSIPREAEAGG